MPDSLNPFNEKGAVRTLQQRPVSNATKKIEEQKALQFAFSYFIGGEYSLRHTYLSEECTSLKTELLSLKEPINHFLENDQKNTSKHLLIMPCILAFMVWEFLEM